MQLLHFHSRRGNGAGIWGLKFNILKHISSGYVTSTDDYNYEYQRWFTVLLIVKYIVYKSNRLKWGNVCSFFPSNFFFFRLDVLFLTIFMILGL